MTEPTPLPRTFSLRARYLVPIQGPAVENGFLTIHDGQISALGKLESVEPIYDLGNVILMPGLVNAHTHLEFSDLARPLPAGENFSDWIRSVIAYRQEQRTGTEDLPTTDESHLHQTVRQGLQQSTQSGVTTVGEISTLPETHTWYQNCGVQTVLFQEVLGLSADRIDELLKKAAFHITDRGSASPPCEVGLSPHAPYSIHCDLLQRVCQLAADSNVPCALHLAESRAEMELLETGSGPLREMLEALQVWDSSAIPKGISPLDYLRWMRDTPRALIIHGNFLVAQEHEFLAQHADRMSLIYCPRTYHHFQDTPYPLQTILDRGVLVALGTDSRASNPDLNLFAEMQYIAQAHPTVDPALLLRIGTLHGARALGLESTTGSIEAGKRADLITVACDPQSPSQLSEAVTSPESRVEGVMSAGQWLVEPPLR